MNKKAKNIYNSMKRYFWPCHTLPTWCLIRTLLKAAVEDLSWPKILLKILSLVYKFTRKSVFYETDKWSKSLGIWKEKVLTGKLEGWWDGISPLIAA